MHDSAQQFLLDSVLEEKFGLAAFRSKQREVINALMKGKHTLALLPTGYGKSLCYQVPSQILPGTTLVVSPLIALMQDQLSGLSRRGITNASCLNSTLSPYEQDQRLARIRSGDIKLLYVAPERFESPRFRKLLSEIELSLVVIDEAHCISEWGHDFRLQYRNLSTYLANFKKATILALTATATPQVQRDIVKTLTLPRMQIINADFDRPNLRLETRSLASAGEKEQVLLDLLERTEGSAIVYTSSRKEAERVASILVSKGISACFYHAGLDAYMRQRNQKEFESGRRRVIVSTVAFGMGIDKPDIRLVLHFNMPPSLENYYQEAGRAGRDGDAALCYLLYQPKDLSTQKWLISKNYPSEEELYAIFNEIRKQGITPIKAQELTQRLSVNEAALLGALSLLKHLQLIDSTPDGAYFDRHSGDTAKIDMSTLHQRKQNELGRLQHMIDYATKDRCRRDAILDYFGQSLKQPCSGCDVCVNS